MMPFHLCTLTFCLVELFEFNYIKIISVKITWNFPISTETKEFKPTSTVEKRERYKIQTQQIQQWLPYIG